MDRHICNSPRLKEVAAKYPQCPLCGESDAWVIGATFLIDHMLNRCEGGISWKNTKLPIASTFGSLRCRTCSNTVFIDISDEPIVH